MLLDYNSQTIHPYYCHFFDLLYLLLSRIVVVESSCTVFGVVFLLFHLLFCMLYHYVLLILICLCVVIYELLRNLLGPHC